MSLAGAFSSAGTPADKETTRKEEHGALLVLPVCFLPSQPGQSLQSGTKNAAKIHWGCVAKPCKRLSCSNEKWGSILGHGDWGTSSLHLLPLSPNQDSNPSRQAKAH